MANIHRNCPAVDETSDVIAMSILCSDVLIFDQKWWPYWKL